jgi:hypothetical protein
MIFAMLPKLYFMSQKFMKNGAYFGGLAPSSRSFENTKITRLREKNL